jgi:hypothetical protein
MQISFFSASLLRMCSIPETQFPRVTHKLERSKIFKPPTDISRAMAASSNLEGKEHDGFPIFAGILSKQ